MILIQLEIRHRFMRPHHRVPDFPGLLVWNFLHANHRKMCEGNDFFEALFGIPESVNQRKLLLLIQGAAINQVERKIKMPLNIFVLQEFPDHIGAHIAVLRIIAVAVHKMVTIAKAERGTQGKAFAFAVKLPGKTAAGSKTIVNTALANGRAHIADFQIRLLQAGEFGKVVAQVKGVAHIIGNVFVRVFCSRQSVVKHQQVILEVEFAKTHFARDPRHKSFALGHRLAAGPVNKSELVSPAPLMFAIQTFNIGPVILEGIGEHRQGEINHLHARKGSEVKRIFIVLKTVVGSQLWFHSIGFRAKLKQMANPDPKSVQAVNGCSKLNTGSFTQYGLRKIVFVGKFPVVTDSLELNLVFRFLCLCRDCGQKKNQYG